MAYNPINGFYDYLKKRKQPADKLEVLGVLYRNRLIEKGYVKETDDFYKCMKLLVAYQNKISNEHHIYDRKKSCRILFEMCQKNFEQLSKLKYSRLDILCQHLENCNDFLSDWCELYSNTGILSYEGDDIKSSEVFVLSVVDVLNDVFFTKNNIDTAYDEIKVYLELTKNE